MYAEVNGCTQRNNNTATHDKTTNAVTMSAANLNSAPRQPPRWSCNEAAGALESVRGLAGTPDGFTAPAPSYFVGSTRFAETMTTSSIGASW